VIEKIYSKFEAVHELTHFYKECKLKKQDLFYFIFFFLIFFQENITPDGIVLKGMRFIIYPDRKSKTFPRFPVGFMMVRHHCDYERSKSKNKSIPTPRFQMLEIIFREDTFFYQLV
jgi:hypothetical protein